MINIKTKESYSRTEKKNISKKKKTHNAIKEKMCFIDDSNDNSTRGFL